MAIKVNGTTVINDSRALTNIASVDSATVTALGNAGVGGGATSLITNWTNVPNSKTWSLSLSSSYDIIRVYFNRVGVDNQAAVDQFFQLQYSGGTDTSYNYMYTYDNGNSGGRQTFPYVVYGYVDGSGAAYPDFTSGFFEFSWHGDSSRLTQFRVHMLSEDGTDRYSTIRFGFNSVARAHTAVFFTSNYSSTVNYNSGQYLVMGVNL